MALRQVFFGGSYTDVPIYRLNKDDYAAFSNKTFLGRPTNYNFQRLIPNPVVTIWPVPNNTYQLVYYWRNRYAQDVGELPDELEVPQRWQRAIIYALAADLAEDIPSVQENTVVYLRSRASSAMIEAIGEERDPSNSNLAPDLSVYN
jgi:hypothetical protein